jgi:hypothetical protein
MVWVNIRWPKNLWCIIFKVSRTNKCEIVYLIPNRQICFSTPDELGATTIARYCNDIKYEFVNMNMCILSKTKFQLLMHTKHYTIYDICPGSALKVKTRNTWVRFNGIPPTILGLRLVFKLRNFKCQIIRYISIIWYKFQDEKFLKFYKKW